MTKSIPHIADAILVCGDFYITSKEAPINSLEAERRLCYTLCVVRNRLFILLHLAIRKDDCKQT